MNRVLVVAVFLVAAWAVPAGSAKDIADIAAAHGITGGLIVHVGCGDGQLTSAHRNDGGFVIHGLDTDPAKVAAARQRIREAGSYGPISVDLFDGQRLPYVDNLVNLLVIRDGSSIARSEILRVLAPGGTAVTLDATLSPQETIVKPWPEEMDQWTHYLHDTDNNAVSQDEAIVAPLKHLQWTGGPRYSRHHDKSSSVPAVVSAQGRMFYIVDEAPRASILWDPAWQLVARDAFNGVVLWRKTIEQWTSHLWPLKSGPANSPRRLVAVDDAVYVTLGLLAPVSKLDGATGREIRRYAGTENTEEILLKDGILYLVVNPSIDPTQRGGSWAISPKTAMAVRESDGVVLWQREMPWIAPVTLTVHEGSVYLCDGPRVVALDRQTGKTLWQSVELPWRDQKMPTYFAPTLVAAGSNILYVGGEDWHEHAGSKGLMTCLDAGTGEVKWQQPHLPSGYQSPQDVFVIDNQVWCGSLNSKPGEFDKRYPDVSPSTGEFIAYDLDSGKLARTIPRGADCYWFHHRCYRARATKDYFLTSRTGIEMIDVHSGQWSLHHWVRGACLYGIMPANGLIYAPPHPCACYPEAKLSGFNALSGPRTRPAESHKEPRMERGPAYGEQLDASPPTKDDWPTFRGNAVRDGSTPASVDTDLATSWQTKLGGRLSQPVVAGDQVFVANIDQHSVVAIDRLSGEIQWKYLAGGRVDSPPTVHEGLVLFGSTDGHVYCLRASDGALAWRFRAAPIDQRLMSYGQLESVWPVHGSVLVRDGVVHFVAGRSMFLDGGLTLYRLDPQTGKVLSATAMDDRNPQSGEDLHRLVTMLDMPVASADILSSDGDYLFMRSQPFDLAGKRLRVNHVGLDQQRGDDAHLFVPNGFLDDNWWHRAFWVYGRSVLGGPAYGKTGQSAPGGKMMVLDRDHLFIFGRQQKYWRWTTPLEFRLFCVDRRPSESPLDASSPKAKTLRRGNVESTPPQWSIEIPVLVRAMVKAGDTLFAAGPADTVDEVAAFKSYDEASTRQQLEEQAAQFAGRDGSLLWAVSAKDGSKRQEIKLDSLPVFDGMIAAHGALYISTVDGRIVCLATGSD